MLNGAQKADIAKREVTIMGDKNTPYSVLKKIMLTCSDAEYGKVSFAVVERERAATLTWQPRIPPQRTPTAGSRPITGATSCRGRPSEEMERRFRVILRNLVIAFAIFAVLMPFLPRHERVVNTDSLPERVVQLVMEPPPPPPPPPPPKPEKPLEKAPVAQSRRRCRSRWIRASRPPRAVCSRTWTISRRCATRSTSTSSPRISRRPPIPAM